MEWRIPFLYDFSGKLKIPRLSSPKGQDTVAMAMEDGKDNLAIEEAQPSFRGPLDNLNFAIFSMFMPDIGGFRSFISV